MSNVKEHIILCNSAASPKVREEVRKDVLTLDYLSANKNVVIKLPSFVNSLYHLPNKIKDLLEIAAFIMDTDRLIRTFAWVCAREARLREVQAAIHPYYHSRLFLHQDRTLEEWREIFAAAINARAEKEAQAELARLEAELAALEPPEKQIESKLKEIARIQGLI